MFKKGFLILVAGLFLLTGCKEQEIDTAQKTQVFNQSTIYYFHGNARCLSCHKIENYTNDVFDEFFKDKLDLQIVNIEESSNKHFITDYGLYTKSIILVKVKNGKEIGYKNLDKVWNYLGNEEKFKSYIKYEIKTFLFNTGD